MVTRTSCIAWIDEFRSVFTPISGSSSYIGVETERFLFARADKVSAISPILFCNFCSSSRIVVISKYTPRTSSIFPF